VSIPEYRCTSPAKRILSSPAPSCQLNQPGSAASSHSYASPTHVWKHTAGSSVPVGSSLLQHIQYTSERSTARRTASRVDIGLRNGHWRVLGSTFRTTSSEAVKPGRTVTWISVGHDGPTGCAYHLWFSTLEPLDRESTLNIFIRGLTQQHGTVWRTAQRLPIQTAFALEYTCLEHWNNHRVHHFH
jgi:hypothetical protein